MMVGFIDDQRATYGVEPICAVLPIAPSTYFRHRAERREERHGVNQWEVVRYGDFRVLHGTSWLNFMATLRLFGIESMPERDTARGHLD